VKKLLIGAGVITVALFGYKTFNGGSLGLPPALSSWFSSESKGPMKKNFPSQANAGSEQGVGQDVAGAELPGGANTAPAQAASTDSGTPSFSNEDVNSRIAQAVELSKDIVINGGAQAKSVSAAGNSGPAAVSTFGGHWRGKFAGPDAGSIALSVDPSGVVTGKGVSTMTGIEFTLSGKVLANGQIDLTQSSSGVTGVGATFTGNMLAKEGKAGGVWTIAAYNVTGTWYLDAVRSTID
jgi:hypothetical protein